MNLPSLGLVFNFPQTKSFSMDFCSEMLLNQLEHDSNLPFKPEAIIPQKYYRILTRIPWLGRKFPIRTLEIMLNNLWVYPQALKKVRDRLAQAAKYSWAAHAKTISDAYKQLLKL